MVAKGFMAGLSGGLSIAPRRGYANAGGGRAGYFICEGDCYAHKLAFEAFSGGSRVSVAEQSAGTDSSQHPTQSFGTTGIKPLQRPSLVARLFMAVVSFVERLNLTYSKVGNPPIYDNAVFPWTKTIERDWSAIRDELDRVLTRKNELPGFHELATDDQPGPRLEDLRARGLWLPLSQKYRSVSANLGRLSEHPRTDHGHVLDSGAWQASAAAPRPL
jgi:hypothetical protein